MYYLPWVHRQCNRCQIYYALWSILWIFSPLQSTWRSLFILQNFKALKFKHFAFPFKAVEKGGETSGVGFFHSVTDGQQILRKPGTHQAISYKGRGQGLRWGALWAVLLLEVAGTKRPQPSHSSGLGSRGRVMVTFWIMTLSGVKKAEFTKDAAGGRVGEASLLPSLINTMGTPWAWCRPLPPEGGCVWSHVWDTHARRAPWDRPCQGSSYSWKSGPGTQHLTRCPANSQPVTLPSPPPLLAWGSV